MVNFEILQLHIKNKAFQFRLETAQFQKQSLMVCALFKGTV